MDLDTPSDPIAHLLAKKSLFCYKASITTSTGIWLGDWPFNFSFPLLLAQISLIFAATRLTHAVLKHLGQPQVISHVIAGILLGPSLLSHNQAFEDIMFPPRSWIHLDIISLFSFMLFIFIIGVKTDLNVIRKSGKSTLAIAEAGTLLPFVLVILVAFFILPTFSQNVGLIDLVVQLSARWAITSNTVVACFLNEFNLLTSKLGRLAMSASLIADFQNMFLSSASTAIFLGVSMSSISVGTWSFATFIGFLAFIFLVARPLTVWMIRRTPEGGTMDEAYFLTVLLMAIGCGLAGELIGQHATMGPLMLGLALPGGPPLGTTLVERLDRFVSGLFLPVYMAIAGLRTNLFELVNGDKWGFAAVLIGVSVTAKFGAVLAVCLFLKMPLRDAVIVSLMMSCRGIVDIHSVNDWQDTKRIDKRLYAINILGILAVGGLSAALLKLLYKPSFHFLPHKRRSIQHARRTEEFRIMACVLHPDNVPPLLTLLEVSHPTRQSPISVYLLHLIPLVGRTTATLAPYKKKRRHRSSFKSTSSSSLSDNIVNAFCYLEKQNLGCLSVIPFVGTAPYATMHDDVCSLALDKRVFLVILPFHKCVEYANASVQAMNINVLRYAPCSVAILVSHGLSGGPACAIGTNLLHRLAVYFLGGADDCEALAYASRMAANPAVGLTVVRFLLPEELRKGGEEERMDDEAVGEFRVGFVDRERVVYREEVVADGAGMVKVIRGMCSEDYSLLIVGRREGKESPLTAGLEEWSEYPELGVIGDILASADFGVKVSTLVVQQRAG